MAPFSMHRCKTVQGSGPVNNLHFKVRTGSMQAPGSPSAEMFGVVSTPLPSSVVMLSCAPNGVPWSLTCHAL